MLEVRGGLSNRESITTRLQMLGSRRESETKDREGEIKSGEQDRERESRVHVTKNIEPSSETNDFHHTPAIGASRPFYLVAPGKEPQGCRSLANE